MLTNFVYDTANVHCWTSVETISNESGQIERQNWVFDDDLHRSDFYDAGQLQFSELTDHSIDGSARKWTLHQTWFDENGDKDFTYIVNDDGLRIWADFHAGQVCTTWAVDSQCRGGAADFQYRMTDYDPLGNAAKIVTLYDDFSHETERFYADGSQTIQYKDTSNHGCEFKWENKSEFYDNTGEIQSRFVQFDTGDMRAVTFADGVRARSVSFDFDCSKRWAAKEVLYDDNGKKEQVIYHDSWDDLVDEFNFDDLGW